MNSLEGVSSDDDIGNGCAIVEDEDSTVTASVGIRVAGPSTIEFLVAEVLAASDVAWCRERYNFTNTSGDVEGLSRRDAGDKRDECDLGDHGEDTLGVN